MISIIYNLKKTGFLFFSAIIILSACNKKVEQFPEAVPVAPAGIPLGETIAANASYSLFYNLITRADMVAAINNKAAAFTIFAADNTAMKIFINAISGGAVPVNAPDAVFSGFISTNIPVATAAAIISYNVVPQALPTTSIPSAFPNLQYPTIFNPAPAVSAFLRLTTFPSTNNGAWINNIPLAGADIVAANGVIHPSAFLVTPPQRFLWDRISTDPGLTYFKAALLRADSGVAATSSSSLVGALNNIGANLTVFAPTDSAFRAVLTGAIYRGLLGLGLPDFLAQAQATALASTPDVFNNSLLFGILTPQTVKGILVYQILGTRVFTNNFPTVYSYIPTLLNSAIPLHPGIGIRAVFGAPFVTSATVRGDGNATASNIIINPSPLIPDPLGTSDQQYLNGVLHKIDQVLLPQ